MQSRRRYLASLGALVLLTSLIAVQSARAATTYTVRFGAGVPKGFTARVFAPPVDRVPTIRVLRGDIIDLFGAQIVLPVGVGPLAWWAENVDGNNRPLSAIKSDPDADLPGVEADYKFNFQLFMGNATDCGAGADAPCTYNGTGDILNGGDRFETADGHFFVEITANPGDTLYAINPFSVNKRTILRIEVVADPTAVTTQAAIDAARTRLLARDRDEAVALDAKLSQTTTRHRDPKTGKMVYDAYAGFDTETIVLFAMYPRTLTVRRGDKVRWHFDVLQNDAHTATFPVKAGVNIARNAFRPACDPDGDDAPGPDVAPDFQSDPPCPAGAEPEFDLANNLTSKTGRRQVPRW